jgi:hypothetical protein
MISSHQLHQLTCKSDSKLRQIRSQESRVRIVDDGLATLRDFNFDESSRYQFK